VHFSSLIFQFGNVFELLLYNVQPMPATMTCSPTNRPAQGQDDKTAVTAKTNIASHNRPDNCGNDSEGSDGGCNVSGTVKCDDGECDGSQTDNGEQAT
jgi:hypothetical protein